MYEMYMRLLTDPLIPGGAVDHELRMTSGTFIALGDTSKIKKEKEKGKNHIHDKKSRRIYILF